MGTDEYTNPLNWGWRHMNICLVPVMMVQKPAPDVLLKVVHCNCTPNCKNARCGCKKYVLPCTDACGPCQTDSCFSPYSNVLELGKD